LGCKGEVLEEILWGRGEIIKSFLDKLPHLCYIPFRRYEEKENSNMNTVVVKENKIDLTSLTQEQLEAIQKAVFIDDLKKEYVKERRKTSFNTEYQLELFLSEFSSIHTIRMYRNAVNNFTTWSKGELVDISRRDVMSYLRSLEGKAPSTIKFYLSGISSFYNYLVDSEYLERNPFSHVSKKVKKSSTNKKYIPSQSDIEALQSFFEKKMKKNTFAKMKLSLKLLNEYGVRKGFLDHVVLEGNKLVSISKGKEYSVKIAEKDLTYFKSHANLLEELNSNTMSVHFLRGVNELVSSGELSEKFSPHCLRHKYAVEKYKECGDSLVVKNLLNHSSLGVTEVYLKSLGIV
jgi:site-specific recombinase XerD